MAALFSSPVVTGEGDREAVEGAAAGLGLSGAGPLRLASLDTSPVTTGEENSAAISA